MSVSLFPAFFQEDIVEKIRSDSKVKFVVEENMEPVYRGTTKKILSEEDFLSHQELGDNPENSYTKYACSVFYGEKGLKVYLKKCKAYPKMQRDYPYIANGLLRSNSGWIRIGKKSKHVNWWIFDNHKSSVHTDFSHFIDVQSGLSEKEEDD